LATKSACLVPIETASIRRSRDCHVAEVSKPYTLDRNTATPPVILPANYLKVSFHMQHTLRLFCEELTPLRRVSYSVPVNGIIYNSLSYLPPSSVLLPDPNLPSLRASLK
jgi:hypothetical protein